MNGEKRRYYLTRKPFIPEIGKCYENEGGSTFQCLKISAYDRTVTMQNTISRWTFEAVGIGVYEDGKIDWDYSLNGRFPVTEE